MPVLSIIMNRTFVSFSSLSLLIRAGIDTRLGSQLIECCMARVRECKRGVYYYDVNDGEYRCLFSIIMNKKGIFWYHFRGKVC